ncbi:hypothetical protein GCM10011578_097350 [Streptomyces fuscichromogenes]|uniref:Diiron oxygenase n=2 Tax=Streptomyces fuscichromogenes TaxID=1324013 RepID=A0A918CXP6_9ACTN|nr:hypothetical protein GCM10011578_097350 [Streptomyces fuscichromogenes]
MHSNGSTALERDALVQLTRRWGKRVAVKRDELDLDGHFDESKPDFARHLVPVLALPAARGLDPEAEHRILAGAWISYNAKTQAIEEEIILPACRLMLGPDFPLPPSESAVAVLHQTIIDEHYHILMCHNAAGVTRRRRGLPRLAFPSTQWSVVRALGECVAAVSGPGRDIVRVAFALAAETTINSFLSTLADSHEIQPMNRLTVDLHRKDESGHAVVFRVLATRFFGELSSPERELFLHALTRGLEAFGAPDHAPWTAVASLGGLTVDEEQLRELRDCCPAPKRDTTPLRKLLADLGVEPAALGA